jgi:hypothetical protein
LCHSNLLKLKAAVPILSGSEEIGNRSTPIDSFLDCEYDPDPKFSRKSQVSLRNQDSTIGVVTYL